MDYISIHQQNSIISSATTFSEEQLAIAYTVRKGVNVIVEANAGSGKSTTCRAIHVINPDKKMLILTYNKDLSEDTRSSFLKHHATTCRTVEIQTIHAFVMHKYDYDVWEDGGIMKVLENDTSPYKALEYDILCLDECQDHSPLYSEMIMKIAKDCGKDIQFVVLGDRKQEIYAFKGKDADRRFLTDADIIYQEFTNRHWERHELLKTFRLSVPHCNFMNEVVYGGETRYIGIKSGLKPTLIRSRDPYKAITTLLETEKMLEKYAPEDIFVLCFSQKKNRLCTS